LAEDSQLDPSEVGRLFEEHAAALLRYLVGVLRDHELANDVLQVSFKRLQEKGGGTRPEARRAWLYRVAHNEALAVRRRAATGSKVVTQLSWQLDPTVETPESQLLRQESIEQVQRAIEGLPANQAEVVRMRIYENKRFVEIAAELDIPLGTALGRMRAALKKLRERIDG
jgi:RNA polymerase sigma-70 factor (ECF subfamily)